MVNTAVLCVDRGNPPPALPRFYGIIPTVKKRTCKTTKIGIFLDIPGLACTRAISGLYRFARHKPDWRIFLFPVQRGEAALRKIAANFTPDAIFTGHADVVRAYGGKIPYVILVPWEYTPTLSGTK